MKKTTWLAVLFAAVWLVSGCGFGDKIAEEAAKKTVEELTGVKVEENNGSTTLTTKDGSVTFSESGSLPEGFPLPIVSDTTVSQTNVVTSGNDTMYNVTLSFTGDAKAIADFYKKALTDLKMEVNTTEMTQAGTAPYYMVSGKSDKLEALIQVFGGQEEGEKTVQITCSVKK
jgi:hypothetical protein